MMLETENWVPYFVYGALFGVVIAVSVWAICAAIVDAREGRNE